MPKPQTVMRTLGVAVAAFAPALLLFGAAGWAAPPSAVQLINTIPIPPSTPGGKLFSYDISFFDNANQVDYLADRSNKVVDEFDEVNGVLSQIAPNNGFGPFVGFVPCPIPGLGANDCAGPDGVVTARGSLGAGQWLLVTDGNSRVISIDVFTGLTEGEVFTSPNNPRRADEIAFDPRDSVALAINNADDPPFATLIGLNPITGQLTGDGNLFLDPAHTGGLVDATNGAEQPVWDPTTGKFFLALPQNGPDPAHGAVIRIDPATLTVEAAYDVALCSPAGLALGPGGRLLVGCNLVFDTAGGIWTGHAATDPNTAAPQYVVLDAATGGNQRHITGVGAGDEVWFNSGDNNYYTASSGSPLAPNALFSPPLNAQGAAVLGVIDATSGSESLLQLVPTFNVPAVAGEGGHPAGTAHSVAASATTNRVYVPLAANNVFPNCLKGCIAVYSR